MQIKTILVPVDFSDCSDELVGHAAGLAHTHGAELIFFHAIEDVAGVSPNLVVRPEPDMSPVSMDDWRERDVKAHLTLYTEAASRQGLTARALTRHADHTDGAILAAADETDADLILMNTHGRRGLSRLVLGSVAEAVLRQSAVPVLVFRTQHKPTCEASSCATCTASLLRSDRQPWAEADG